MLETLTAQLAALEPLTRQQVAAAVEQLIDANISPAVKADFLEQLSRKGETVEEIAEFARVLREKSIPAPLDPQTRAREILDVVGTGGDRLGTFNISTTTAIICASAGILVAKHGNRAATSQCGSADVLEALGVPIALPPPEAAASLRDLGFAFFFAPNYHPTFKHVAAARKLCAERGRRTIFNFLGPLLNPARPSAQLIGVPRPELCEPLARVSQSLGVRRAIVVCGAVPDDNDESRSSTAAKRFLDELSTLGENVLAEFYHEKGFHASKLDNDHFSLQPATLADLLGGDRQTNAQIVHRLLDGKERGPKRDAILLNSAAALLVAGRAGTMSAGWDLAAELIDSGHAGDKLRELVR